MAVRVRGPAAPRDERRRRLGQNFLAPELADRFVAEADIRPGELALEIEVAQKRAARPPTTLLSMT